MTTKVTSNLDGTVIDINGNPFTDFSAALDHLLTAGIAHPDAHRALKDARYLGTATV